MAAAISSASIKREEMLSADGPRASVNTESNMFNKHYNKELKLCEGKLIFKINNEYRRNPNGSL